MHFGLREEGISWCRNADEDMCEDHVVSVTGYAWSFHYSTQDIRDVSL